MAEAIAAERRPLTDEAPLADDQYWVVYVTDKVDLPNGEISVTRRRFEFHGQDASRQAWDCYQGAKRHDFQARAEKVRKV